MTTQPAVEATGLSKRYGAVQALDDVSVTMADRAVGLLGANGAGKSTLMKPMLGLVRPDAGQITVLGLDVARRSWDVRRRLGYMPEHDCLPLGMTARGLRRAPGRAARPAPPGRRCCAPPRCCSTSAWRRSARA